LEILNSKAEEVSLKLQPLGQAKLPVAFFNAAEDAPEILRAFIKERIRSVQEFHRSALKEVIDGANNLLENYEKEPSLPSVFAARRFRRSGPVASIARSLFCASVLSGRLKDANSSARCHKIDRQFRLRIPIENGKVGGGV
jgi:hypothetical protein